MARKGRTRHLINTHRLRRQRAYAGRALPPRLRKALCQAPCIGQDICRCLAPEQGALPSAWWLHMASADAMYLWTKRFAKRLMARQGTLPSALVAQGVLPSALHRYQASTEAWPWAGYGAATGLKRGLFDRLPGGLVIVIL